MSKGSVTISLEDYESLITAKTTLDAINDFRQETDVTFIYLQTAPYFQKRGYTKPEFEDMIIKHNNAVRKFQEQYTAWNREKHEFQNRPWWRRLLNK